MDNYLNIREAAKYLGIHPGTLRTKARKGEIKFKIYGTRGDKRFKVEDLEKLLHEKPVEKSS